MDLNEAVLNQDIEKIKEILDSGDADINFRSPPFGHTSLFNAVYYNTKSAKRFEIIKLLIQAGADVNIPSDNNETPLYVASADDHPETVELLIQAGADVNAKTALGKTPLMNSIESINYDNFTLLMNSNSNLEIKDDKGNNVLMYAAQRGRYKYAKIILENVGEDFDINDTNDDGETALIIAVKNTAIDTMNLLINAGADLNIADNSDKTVFSILMSRGMYTLAKYVLDKGALDRNDLVYNDLIRKGIKPYFIYLLSLNDSDKMEALKALAAGSSEVFAFEAVSHNDLQALIYLYDNFSIKFNRFKNSNEDTLLQASCYIDNSEMTKFIYEAVYTELRQDNNKMRNFFLNENKQKKIAISIAYESCHVFTFRFLYKEMGYFGEKLKKYVIQIFV